MTGIPTPTQGTKVDVHANVHVRAVGDFMIVVHGAHDPNPQEARELVETVVRWVQDARVPRMLVCSAGGGPNSTQRAELKKRTEPKGYTTAVVTNSRLGRGIVTAFSWLGLAMRAFAVRDLVAAIRFLEPNPMEHKRICVAIAEITEKLEGSFFNALLSALPSEDGTPSRSSLP